jgi:uncharacterized membrane protein YsdA (DUF1294 family)
VQLSLTHIILIYLGAINVVTFFVYGIDKWKAKRGTWRIPEAKLLWLSVAGGSVGALFGMSVWHHKTLRKKFKYGVPLILVAQVALIGLALYCWR